ncbi:MAG: thiol:disulfide interchange protein DsbA/DsbL [Pseudomonadales bacterium]|jgi:thiol:disulfide interchange protein DsbA
MRRLILVAVTSAFALISSTLLGAQYEEGVHYQVLDPQAPLSTSGEGIEVSEYFSYGCGHCFQFDPVLNAWLDKQPEDVNFDRTPAVWNDYYGNLAQTYYTLKAMDLLESLHVAVFEAIHIQRKNLSKPGVMADFLEEAGVDPEAFAKVFNSFGVRMSLQQADARGRAYRASGVPTLIVNGKYRIETRGAGSVQEMLKVAEFLIQLERQS